MARKNQTMKTLLNFVYYHVSNKINVKNKINIRKKEKRSKLVLFNYIIEFFNKNKNYIPTYYIVCMVFYSFKSFF